MTGRQSIEDLLEELYAARVRGDLDAVVSTPEGVRWLAR